jgi:hypothetical protein
LSDEFPYGAAQIAVAYVSTERPEVFVSSTTQPVPVLLLSDRTTPTVVSADCILKPPPMTFSPAGQRTSSPMAKPGDETTGEVGPVT